MAALALLFGEIAQYGSLLPRLFKHYEAEAFEVIEVLGGRFDLLLEAVQVLQYQPLPLVVVVTGLHSPVVFLVDLLYELLVLSSEGGKGQLLGPILGQDVFEFVLGDFQLQLS